MLSRIIGASPMAPARGGIEMAYDFELSDQGSIALVRPLTDAARDWCAGYLGDDDTMMMGDAYAVEPRYAVDIAEGIYEAGLTAPGLDAVFGEA